MTERGQFRIALAIVILISSVVLLSLYLFRTEQIQIVLETGQEVSTQNSGYFPLETVLMMVVASFLIGATSIYLYYKSEDNNIISALRPGKKSATDSYETILPLLKEDEKKILRMLRENKGEILQNAVVLKLGLSKVKVTRLLLGLERKNLIKKERHGFTNKIIFLK